MNPAVLSYVSPFRPHIPDNVLREYADDYPTMPEIISRINILNYIIADPDSSVIQVEVAKQDIEILEEVKTYICTECDGFGSVYFSICPDCRGIGKYIGRIV